jgi:exopolysaccharide production protein ExoZ
MSQMPVRDSTSVVRSSGKLDCIQVFRGVAALLVALHHTAIHVAGAKSFRDDSRSFLVGQCFNTDLGMIGVDLFFIVSGFIMVYTTADGRITPAAFLKKRGLRIYPVYWFFCLVVIGLHLTPWVGRLEGNTAIFLKSFTLYPVFWYNLDLLRPAFLPQGWTLTYEVLFYLVFAATMRLKPFVQLTVVAAGFAAANLLAPLFASSRSAEVALLSDSILLEFPLGMLLGIVYCKRHPFLTPAVSWTIFAAALISVPLLWYVPGPRVLKFGVPALLLISALVLGRKTESLRFPRWLVFMGDASYSIYLTHTIVLLLIRVGYDRLRLLQTMPHDLHYLVSMIAIATAGALSYLWVEKPLLTLCRKLN